MSDVTMRLFYELFESTQYQGPGSDESTRKALSFCENLGRQSRILDVGCGSGRQSLCLLQETDAQLSAVDNHQPFLDILQEKAQMAGFTDKLTCLRQDMNDLDFVEESFDLIWSEGAIYIMGFDKGLSQWQTLLKPGGLLVVTELSWLSEQRPEEAVSFWSAGYPSMRSVDENLAVAGNAGYGFVGSFVLPARDWTEGYYQELSRACDTLQQKYSDLEEVEQVVTPNLKEMELYDRAGWSYGYVFYIMQKGR